MISVTDDICDMIKGNQSDVVNFDFELYKLKEVTNSYVLHCLKMQRIAHISGTRCRIVMAFGSKCSIWNAQVDYICQTKNWILPTCDSFLLIVSHALPVPAMTVCCHMIAHEKVVMWPGRQHHNTVEVAPMATQAPLAAQPESEKSISQV